MKSLLNCLLNLTLFSLVFISCSKDKNEDGSNGEGTFTASINEMAFSATDDVLALNGMQGLTIQGSRASEMILINIPDYQTPARYNIDKGEAMATYFKPGILGSFMAMRGVGSGSVTITGRSGEYITGTFSFKSVSDNGAITMDIAKGKFNVRLFE